MAKKRKKYNKYRGFVIFAVGLVCFLAIAFNGYIHSTPSGTGAPQANTGNDNAPQPPVETHATVTDNTGSLNRQQIAVLEKYATLYAQTLQSMQPRDISSLYRDTSSAAYNLNSTALKVLTSIRGMREKDLTLEYAVVDYTVNNVENGSGKATVYLQESNTQKFRHLSQPSLSTNLNHIFTLVENNGDWLISKHEHEEDFYLLTAECWDDASGSTNSERAEDALRIAIADAKENLDDLSRFQQGTYYTNLKVADTSYDRDRAIAYAQKWWNTRNYTDRYLAYDEFGGNCQNFASQCLYAGGMDMDYTGAHDNQWKFYDETLNNRATASGRSYSWTGVDMFYSYALISYESGLVALTDIDYNYAEKGDIIHVGAYYQWRHALFITDVMRDADGNVTDIIVASNTADRWNYPLSAYIYTAPRLIHILGQN